MEGTVFVCLVIGGYWVYVLLSALRKPPDWRWRPLSGRSKQPESLSRDQTIAFAGVGLVVAALVGVIGLQGML